MEHTYAVIMAGGGGTRLWPVSRKEKPKQSLLGPGQIECYENNFRV
jgi:mannose-1-phosphate guanylyltransferase